MAPRLPAALPPFAQPVGSYDTYEAAQKAVDHLADEKFPVENVAIVGSDLRTIERVTGRLTWPRALGAGAVSGAWFGLLVGLLLGIFVEDSTWVSLILLGLLYGAVFGLIFAAASYAATGGRRDFTSTSRIVAGSYEVLCSHDLAERARSSLAKLSLSG